MRADDVAVEVVDDEAALLELRLDDVRDRRLPRAREPCEPEHEAPHVCSPHSVRSVPAQRPVAALARLRGVRVADRLVAAVVERVVRQPALADVGPAVVFGPVGERVRLPELVAGVPAELRRVRANRRLVAADPGDPAVEIEQRPVEGLDLRDREVEVGIRVPEAVLNRRAGEDLDLRPVTPLDLAPELVRLREEMVRVDREHARLRLVLEQHVEQDRLLLLERARERNAAGELVEDVLDDPLRRPGLDVSRYLQARHRAAPPSACRRAGRAGASRARSPLPAGCCRG